MANKYVPLSKSNVDICFTASSYKQFRAFAALCGMPATFISDDETDECIKSPGEGPIMMTPSRSATVLRIRGSYNRLHGEPNSHPFR